MTFRTISPGSRLARLLIIQGLAAVATMAPVPCHAGSGFERGLGRPVAEQLEEEIGLVADPALSAWVRRIGTQIVLADGGDPRDYTFKILDSDDVNAFAIPGGFIYVTIGLLRFVDSEDELAATLGHEVAHVTAHHGVNQFRRDVLLTLGLILLRGRVSDVTSTLGQVGGVLYSLRHSRSDEAAADAEGARKTARAGYDPLRMADFLRKLDAREKHKPSHFEVYFMTHPPTAQRLAKVSLLPEADERNLTVRRAVARSLEARGLYRQAIRVHEQILSREPGDAEGHLAAARCWERIGRWDRAAEERRRARALDPGITSMSAAAPPEPVAPAPAADAAAVARAAAALARTHARIGEAEEAGRKRVGDTRHTLDSAKRRFRRLLATLDAAARSTTAGDIGQQEMLHQMGIAVADLERAITRVDATTETADSLPGQLTRDAETLHQRLGGTQVGRRFVELAETFPTSAERALAELDKGLSECGRALKGIDAAVRVCQAAARDLVDCAFLPAPVALARVSPINSRIQVALRAARSAAGASDEACVLAEAAEARWRIFALDRLGYDTPAAQHAAIRALFARRFGISECQAPSFASEGARFGHDAASLLLGLAVRVPLRTPASAPGEAPTREEDDRPIKPLTIDQALERGVPLAPLNVSMRLFALDVERESGENPRP